MKHRCLGIRLWLFMVVLFAVVAADLCAQFEFEQKYEWMYRPPRYDRKVGRLVGYYATPFVEYDPLRKRTFVAGDAYDVHFTTNEGRTWTPMFDTLFWFLDFKNGLQIRRDGTYLWYGTIYNSSNYMNILSEDGGATWRIAILDTLAGVFGGRDEQPGFVVQPSFHAWQGYRARAVTPPSAQGVFVTANNGRSFKRFPYPPDPLTILRAMSPGDSLVAAYHGRNWYVANVVNDTAFQPKHFGGHNVNDWAVTSDGWVVGTSSNGVIVQTPDGLDTRELTLLAVHRQQDSARFTPTHLVHPARDTKVLFDARGGIAVYRNGWNAPVLVHVSDSLTPLTPVPWYGHNDTLFTYSYGRLGDPPQRRSRYITVDLRTLDVRTVEADGPTQHFTGPVYPMRLVAPLSASRWVVQNVYYPGYMKSTVDAGATWKLLDIEDRIDFAPHTYGGVRQILPTGKGAPVLRTDINNVLVPSEDGYRVAIETAFSASIRRGTVNGSGIVPTLTRGEHLDFNTPSVRIAYGDQPLVAYDDASFVTTGGGLLRWSTSGQFLDTVFPIQNTHFNRLDNGVWVLGGDSTWFTFNKGKEWVYVSRAFPHRLNREGTNWPTAPVSASISADDGAIFVGRRGMRKDFRGEIVDSIVGGLLRTTDLGNTWAQVDSIDRASAVLSLARTRQGTLLCLSADIIHMPEGKAWIAGAVTHDWFYGRMHLHRSTDHGRTWKLSWLLRYDPEIPQAEPKIYVADDDLYIVQPNSGVFRSTNDGLRWSQLDLTSLAPTYGINDIWQPGDGYLHFATDSGYARMKFEDIAYTSVEQELGQGNSPSIAYFEHSHELVVDTQEYGSGDIVVVDMRGAIVFRTETVAGRVHRLPPLPSGAYVAAVRTPQGVTSMPLIITR